VAGLAGSLTVQIPSEGYVLAGRGLEGALEARKLVPGDRLSLHLRLDPPELEAYPHILGAGPLLLLDGQVVLDARLEGFQPLFRRQRAARSAIGQTGQRTFAAGYRRQCPGKTKGSPCWRWHS
jgi:hypothetical protein